MANGNDLQNAAYVSFTSLENFVNRLKETAIPPVIDGSILSYTSGSAASQIRTALRFLRLTEVKETKDHVTQRLRDLVAAHGNEKEWKEQWQGIVEDVYDPITKDIELKEATVQQLRDAIRVGSGAAGSLDRAVRFYISALDAAGIDYSPHFRPNSRGSTSGAKTSSGPATKKKRAPKKSNAADGDSSLPEDWERFQLPIPGHDYRVLVEVPKEMDDRQWKMIRRFVEDYFGIGDDVSRVTSSSA